MIRRIIFAAAVALIAAGCAVNDPEEASSVCGGHSPEFYADLSSVTEETRTYVDSDLNLRWTADDRISIFTNTYNQEYRFTGKTGSSSGSFDKVSDGKFVTGNSIDRNYAVYPYNEDTELIESGEMTITLPAVQAYAEDTFGLGANTMVAVTSGTSDYFLPFKNLCGYLVVKLYGDATVKSVSLKGNDGEKISGTATLTPRYGEAPSVTVSQEGTETITVNCGEGVTLGTTKETATAFWFVIPPVTFSKGFTITVTDTEGGTMEKSTSSSKSIQRNVKNSMAAFEVKFEEPVVPEYVDLGLSVKWATFNVGASKPEDYGDHFAWGETTGYDDGKTTFNWSTYKWCNGSKTTLTKYKTKSNYGTVDNKTVLEADDDVAYVKWGGNWRIPTDAEWTELRENCTWIWTTVCGVNGRLVTSNKEGYTDKSIFLPAAGYRGGGYLGNVGSGGYYWSSSLSTDDPSGAWHVYFNSGNVYRNNSIRYFGQSVRPVYGEYIPVTSVTLSETSVSLTVGSTKQLTATCQPSSSTCPDIRWSSGDESVATVSADGLLTAVSEGTCTITVYASSGVKAECAVTVKPEHEYVDLGLSVKWATCNVGASKPEEYGDYFAWGETTGYDDGKTTFDLSTYKWCNGSFTTLTKYNTKSDYGIVDNKTVLDADDDVAHVRLGGSWRMPTYAEWDELIANCTWTWTTVCGVNGYLVTSKKEGYTGKSIFLPATGYRAGGGLGDVGSYGHYWSSSLNTYDPGSAWFVLFYSGYVGRGVSGRCYGQSVRPVSE